MKHCPCCKIDVNTNRLTCPICYHVLEDDKAIVKLQPYPQAKSKPKMNIPTKIFLLLSLLASIISILVNVYTVNQGDQYYWSIIVIASILYLWIILKYVIDGHGILTTRIISAFLNASIVLFLIELFLVKSKNYWFTLDMVIPFMIIACTLIVLFLMFYKTDLIIDTLLPLFGLCLISMAPLLLISFLNVKAHIWPEIACAGLGGFTMLYMLVFHFTDVTKEFLKRFHF